MKILHILPNNAGGLTVYFNKLAEALETVGSVKNVIVELDRTTLNTGADTSCIKTRGTSGNSYLIRNIQAFDNGIPRVFRNKMLEDVILSIADDEKPDIAHIHSTDMLPMSVIYTLHVKGIKVISSFHDSLVVCPAHKFYVKKDGTECSGASLGAMCADCFNNDTPEASVMRYSHVINTINSYCDALIAVSEYISRLIKANGVTRSIEVIRTGFEYEIIAPRTGEINKPVNIMFSGRLNFQKGLLVLLEALRGIDKSKYILNIYGDGSDTVYNNVIKKYYPDVNFEYCGKYQKSEKDAVFMKNDLLVIPSIGTEAAGMVQLEAYSYRVPCVLSSAGGIAEYSIKEASVIFESGNVSRLHGILEDLITNPEKIRKMSDEIKLPKLRTFEDMAMEHMAVYERVIACERFKNSAVNGEYSEKCLKRGIRFNVEEIIRLAMEDINPLLEGSGFYIFGTGNASRLITGNLTNENLRGILGFFDNNPDLHGKENEGFVISSPHFKAGAKVLIASIWTKEIAEQLIKLGYAHSDILKVFGN